MNDVQARPRFSWAPIEHKVDLIPPDLYPWLNCTSSLTEALTIRCNNEITIRVISQGYNTISACEAEILHLNSQDQCVIREVILSNAKQHLLLARVVIPNSFVQNNPNFLPQLAHTPLRKLLFNPSDPTKAAVREKLECTKLLQRDWLHKKASKFTERTKPFLWCRRSLFRVNHEHLLLCEIFLPNIPKF